MPPTVTGNLVAMFYYAAHQGRGSFGQPPHRKERRSGAVLVEELEQPVRSRFCSELITVPFAGRDHAGKGQHLEILF